MANLPTTDLGRTGLPVTALGYGAMEFRGNRNDVDLDTAGTVLNQVLDAGINFIDTSPDYGTSEELIGKAISHRRDEFFLASKCGCLLEAPPNSTPPYPHDFTRANVRAVVERSLRRLNTDYIDLVQVHMSPPRATLEQEGTVDEMLALRDEGKIRFIGMSGILPELADHIAMGVFDAFQIPYSALELEHEQAITDAAAAGAGTIIRGGVARGIPTATPDSFAQYPPQWRATFEKRLNNWQSLALDDLLEGMSSMEFLLRFTLSHPALNTTIVGTSNPVHLRDNLAAAERGPLPHDLYVEARNRLRA